MTFRPAYLVIVATALLTLGGCGASPSVTTTGRPTPSGVTSPAVSPTSARPGDSSTQQSQSTRPLSPAAASAAAKTATAVMSFYARPSANAQAWIEGLGPYLSQDAAAAFADTDPATIPAHQVTGTAQVLSASTAGGALIDVPTDAGTYQLLLLKSGSGWLVDQITPPKS
jgi:hypothetical protein